MKLFFTFLCVGIIFCNIAQTDSTRDNYLNDAPAFIANTISTHPLGMLISRVNHNFQIKPNQKLSFSFNLSGGNVWLPNVKSYKPINKTDQNHVKQYNWYDRIYEFDIKKSPAKTMQFYADAIMLKYNFSLGIPINDKQEFKISTRAFSLEKGNNSLLTSDQFLEWFHSNIAGGEDPFARKVYGFNHVGFRYIDENGKKIELDDDSFIFAGIDLTYNYYPEFKKLAKRSIYTNFGIQLGLNTTKYNPNIDIGFNPSIFKKIISKKKPREFIIGLSGGILRQRVHESSKGVQLSNRKQIYSSELYLNYRKQLNNHSYFSIASTYFVQGAYNKHKEFDYLILTGERVSSHWNYAISHLYRPTTGNNLVITYSSHKTAYSVYFREDFLVDNAPDSQSGISIKHSF